MAFHRAAGAVNRVTILMHSMMHKGHLRNNARQATVSNIFKVKHWLAVCSVIWLNKSG